MVAPPKTPAAIATKVSAAVADALRRPDVVKRLTEMDVNVICSTPEEMPQFMKQERERWGNVIRVTETKAE